MNQAAPTGMRWTGRAWTDQPVVVVAERDADPRSWKLDVDQASIDLYVSLLDASRVLTADEATMMVDLVNAWRAHEHEKHIALMAALDEVQRLTEAPKATDTRSPSSGPLGQ